jgi:hypothetical protein
MLDAGPLDPVPALTPFPVRPVAVVVVDVAERAAVAAAMQALAL